MSAPRIPRPPPLTPMQVALTLLLGLVLTGLVAFVMLEVAAVVRFVGWMWEPPT
ncbi:MAG: hypothetical protein JWO52_4077 [Gammaproteobacteria bacterium]|nr:hypothetical protein [Gammaproteobacteria bacterium]